MNDQMDPEARIERIDLSIFSIDSQTTAGDRASFLRLQRFARRLMGSDGCLELRFQVCN